MGICSPRERVTDLIKKCFKPDCGLIAPGERIWQANNLLNPCATIVFTVVSVCQTDADVTITINKKIGTAESFNLNLGESRAITINQIDSIDVLCNGDTPVDPCAINLCMIIHYDRC